MFGLQVVAGDIAPIPAMILTDQAGNPVNLNPLVSLKFRMVNAHTGVVAVDSANATKVQDDNQPATFGQVVYQWQEADTLSAGLYQAWFIVDQGSGRTHYPINDTLYVKISESP